MTSIVHGIRMMKGIMLTSSLHLLARWHTTPVYRIPLPVFCPLFWRTGVSLDKVALDNVIKGLPVLRCYPFNIDGHRFQDKNLQVLCILYMILYATSYTISCTTLHMISYTISYIYTIFYMIYAYDIVYNIIYHGLPRAFAQGLCPVACPEHFTNI